MDTKEKFEKGIIRIENDRIVGMGSHGNDSISLTELDEFFQWQSAKEAAEDLDDTIMKLGCLGLYLFKEFEEKNDPKKAIYSYTPNEDSVYNLHRIAKLFKS